MREHTKKLVHHAKRVVHHLRHRRIVTKVTVLGTFIALNLLFLLIIVVNTLTLPNTMIGPMNVGLRSRSFIRSYITEKYRAPIQVVINAHRYDLTYEHLGIYMDPDKTLEDIYSPNSLPFPGNILAFFSSFFRQRTIVVPFSFTQEFYEYVNKINEAGSEHSDIVYVDQNNKQATLFTPDQPYRVNTTPFQEALLDHFAYGDSPLVIPITKIENSMEQKVSTANSKLAAAYASPLTVIVGINNANQFLTLSPSDLKRYTIASVSTGSGELNITINKPFFFADLAKALSVYASSFNATLAYDKVGNGIKSALIARFDGNPEDSVRVGIDSGPNTDGTVADKYIEIDISQQKLFTFKDGKLLKAYRVSTGKDYPTPVGRFTILNKAGIGYSSIYNVWMPYWMAFSFSNKLHAYFGIHELPYFYSGGNKIQRPRDFIGAPNTGGCVALDVGDAKEVYQLADIGTPVLIYQ